MKNLFTLLVVCLFGITSFLCAQAEAEGTNRPEIQMRDAIIPASFDRIRVASPTVATWVNSATRVYSILVSGYRPYGDCDFVVG